MIKTYKKEAEDIISSAINKLVDFVSPTYGPAGNKAIIDKNVYRMVVDDGVQIARDFELEDKAENAVIKIIREAAIKTNDRVGDGTTGALIIAQSLWNEATKNGKYDKRLVAEQLQAGVKEVTEQLRASAQKITTKEDIEQVAMVSFNNPKIAKMIAELLFKIGPEGVISMDQSNTMETTAEHTNGVEIKNGYLSPVMITDPARALAELDRPYILITSYRITNANDLLGLMNKLVTDGKRELLIIADNVESDALATLVVNRIQGKFMGVAVSAPQGAGKQQFLKDLALITGATYFSEESGNKLDSAELSDLGKAEKVIVRQNKCTIVGGKGDKIVIEQERTKIKGLLDENPKEYEAEDLQLRLARLSNGIAVVKVGAPTDNEAKTLKYKVEDAIHATKAAYASGVVPGAGIALKNIKTSSAILNKALQAPHAKFKENMDIEELELEPGEVYNAITGKKGEAMKVGVIDPVEVIIAQVESAVSIATQLITSYGILVEVPDDKHE